MYHPGPSSSEAKRLLRPREVRSDNTAKDLRGCDQTWDLSSVADGIAKMAADDDGCSMTSITLPESVMTHDSSSFHQVYGDASVGGHNDKSYNGIEVQLEEGKPMYWASSEANNEGYGATEKQYELSDTLDFVPSAMTEEYIIDEVEFTRQLMGYEVGFDGYTSIDKTIPQDDEEEERRVRPMFVPKKSNVQQARRKSNPRPPQFPAKPVNAKPSHRQAAHEAGSPTVKRQVLAQVSPPCSMSGHPQRRSSTGLPIVQQVHPKQATHTQRQPPSGGSATMARQALPHVGQPNIRSDHPQQHTRTGAPMVQQVRTQRIPPSGGSATIARQAPPHVGQPNTRSGHAQQQSQQVIVPKTVMPPRPPTPSQQPRSGVSTPISNLLPHRLMTTKKPPKHQQHSPTHPPFDIEIPAELHQRFLRDQAPSYSEVTCKVCGRLINGSGKCICRMMEI